MADTSFISQDVVEAAADDATASVSQSVAEAGADDASLFISQAVAEVGVDDATTFVSQSIVEAGADDATVLISQTVIEFAVGVVTPIPPEPSTGTFVFDEGGGVEWWIIPQLTDNGVELRDKVIKAVRVTGLVTDAEVKVYTYGPSDPVVVADLEDGLNSRAMRTLPDTTNVAQSPRRTVNCPNAMLSTVRVAGVWDGEGPRNRVDEIVYEVAQQGVRR